MEQVYRRRGTATQTNRQRVESNRPGRYKKNMLRQSLFCLILFAFAVYVKASPGERLEFARQSLAFIATESTDFSKISQQVHQFFQTGIFKESDTAQEKNVLLDMGRPVSAPMTSGFGLRTHPVDGVEKFHYGVDLGAPEGEKIKCVAAGEAVEVGESEEYGKYVLVKHSESIHSFYAHCQEVLPEQGDRIQKGQVIGTVGATGQTTGAHLHFEIRDGDTWLDPAEFMRFEESAS